LSVWAPTHSVTAYDAVAAGRTGLPWPDVNDAGAVSLLQTVRNAAGRRGAKTWPARPAFTLALPVPGDVRGLAAGSQFQRDALAAGEAVVVTGPDRDAVGLVPEFTYDEDGDVADEGFVPEVYGLAWTVYSLPAGPLPDHPDVGDAEYALRSAVRSAAEALGALRLGASGGVDDPRGLVEQLVESGRQHRLPDHVPTRALRVLENAAHVDAIITVSTGLIPIGTQSASEAQIANEALRPLASVVRSARMAAVSAILESAWH